MQPPRRNRRFRAQPSSRRRTEAERIVAEEAYRRSLQQQPPPPKPKRVELAPWWLYVMAVILSMVFFLVLWALVLPAQAGQAWLKVPATITDVALWTMFVEKHKHDPALFRYLPWSLIILYGAIFVTLFLMP